MNQSDLTPGMIVAVKGPGYKVENWRYYKYEPVKILSVGVGRGARHHGQYVESDRTVELTSNQILGVWGGPYKEKYDEQKSHRDAENEKNFALEFKAEFMNERAEKLASELLVFSESSDLTDDLYASKAHVLHSGIVRTPQYNVPYEVMERVVERLRRLWEMEAKTLYEGLVDDAE